MKLDGILLTKYLRDLCKGLTKLKENVMSTDKTEVDILDGLWGYFISESWVRLTT